jgi:hypothetical protein
MNTLKIKLIIGKVYYKEKKFHSILYFSNIKNHYKFSFSKGSLTLTLKIVFFGIVIISDLAIAVTGV